MFSNIYVALPVSALAWITFLVFNQEVNFQILLFIYCSTFIIYNVHRLVGINKVEEKHLSPRHIWAKKYRVVLISGIAIGASVMLYLLFQFEVSFIYTLIPSSLIAIGYSIPLYKKNGKFWRLRDVPFAKVFLIGITVSYVTTYLPVYDFFISDPSNLLLFGFFCARAFFILAITIPFDIRDYDFDEPSTINTLPLVFGIDKARTISLYALAFFAGMSFYLFQTNAFLSLAFLISAMVTAWIVSYAQKKSTEYYFSFVVEGTMLIQFGLVYLLY
ncbi:MAG: hypothetical protein ACPGEG_02660 [Salibacteraceae bacterium]